MPTTHDLKCCSLAHNLIIIVVILLLSALNSAAVPDVNGLTGELETDSQHQVVGGQQADADLQQAEAEPQQAESGRQQAEAEPQQAGEDTGPPTTSRRRRREGIAIDRSNGECRAYKRQSGYRSDFLPPRWTAYFPRRGMGDSINTPLGICDFSSAQAEACCRELGLKFDNKTFDLDQDNKQLASRLIPPKEWILAGFVLAVAVIFVASLGVMRRVS